MLVLGPVFTRMLMALAPCLLHVPQTTALFATKAYSLSLVLVSPLLGSRFITQSLPLCIRLGCHLAISSLCWRHALTRSPSSISHSTAMQLFLWADADWCLLPIAHAATAWPGICSLLDTTGSLSCCRHSCLGKWCHGWTWL